MKRKVILSTTLAAIAATAIAGSAFADNGRGMGMGHGDRDGWPWMGIVMLVAAAALAAGLTWLLLGRRRPAAPVGVPAAVGTAPTASPTAGAEAILAERLARSEISADEYRATLAALRDTNPGPIVLPPPAPEADAN